MWLEIPGRLTTIIPDRLFTEPLYILEKISQSTCFRRLVSLPTNTIVTVESISGTAHRVDGLPRDEHGHDRGLAGPGREFECKAVETGVRLRVGGRETVEEAAAFVAETRRDLGQPDRGLRRFDLAEEGPNVAEAMPLAARARLMATPVLQEPGRFRRDAPAARVWNRPPRIDPAPQLVDHLHELVLLTFRLERP